MYICHIVLSSYISNMQKQITKSVSSHHMQCHWWGFWETRVCAACMREQRACAVLVMSVMSREKLLFRDPRCTSRVLLRAYVMSVLRGLPPVCLEFVEIFLFRKRNSLYVIYFLKKKKKVLRALYCCPYVGRMINTAMLFSLWTGWLQLILFDVSSSDPGLRCRPCSLRHHREG